MQKTTKHKTIITSSKEETQEIAQKLAKTLSPGSILALYGNLGSGKTTFVQGLAKGLGIDTRIISPTFVIVRQHSFVIPNLFRDLEKKEMLKQVQHDRGNFYHIDLYRVESEKDIEGLGLKEIINNSKNIVAIEWPEKMQQLLPQKRTEICMTYLSDNKREIKIKTYE